MTSRWNQHPSPSTRHRSSNWPRIRAKVLTRDGWECQLRQPGCLTEATEVDHIQPVSQGGDDDLDNLAAVCHPCHKKKTAIETAAAQARRSGKRPPRTHPADAMSPHPPGGGTRERPF